jgi:ribosomal protein L37AE/L43A
MKQGTTFICDSCGTEAFSQLKIHSWYGSIFDMTQTSIYLCDKCVVKVRDGLKQNFNIDIKTEDISEL